MASAEKTVSRHKLVVITGPVGGGKSTTAVALGRCLRRRGQTTAVVDLDDMYLMGKQKNDDRWWTESETWSAARRACGALAESFFASCYDVVVVEGGDFETSEQWKELRTCIQPNVDIESFTLVVSWEETFRRAKGDPNRHPATSAVYKKMHDNFISKLPFLRDVSECIDADNLKPEQIATHIAERVLEVPNPDQS
jgi:shikimate kinase